MVLSSGSAPSLCNTGVLGTTVLKPALGDDLGDETVTTSLPASSREAAAVLSRIIGALARMAE